MAFLKANAFTRANRVSSVWIDQLKIFKESMKVLRYKLSHPNLPPVCNWLYENANVCPSKTKGIRLLMFRNLKTLLHQSKQSLVFHRT